MLHTLAEAVLADESLAWDISELRKGPFHIPDHATDRYKAWWNSVHDTEFGSSYCAAVQANRSLFEHGTIRGERFQIAKHISERFGACHFPPNNGEAFNSSILARELVASIVRTIDQIADDQHHRSDQTRTLSLLEIANLVQIYWMHRAIVAWKTGLWKIREVEHGIEFEPTELYTQSLRRHQFAILWDQISDRGFATLCQHSLIEATNGLFGQHGYLPLPPEVISVFAEGILDRRFFLNPRFIQSKTGSPLKPDSWAVAKWLAAIFLGECFDILLPNDERLLDYMGLDQNVLLTMIEHTKLNSESDQGIIVDEQHIHIGNATFNHVCSLYHSLIAYGEAGGKEGSMKTGDWFERMYATKLFDEEEIADDFVVMPGFESVDKNLKYDYDILLYDKRRHLLFFVQLKYRFRKNQYYWSDNFQEFYGGFRRDSRELNPSAIWKGIGQLRGLRKALHDDRVRAQVKTAMKKKSLPDFDFSPDHCKFILLHTVSAFDHAFVDGIVLYEFNTFRNLIRKGRFGYEIRPNVEELIDHRANEQMPIEDPDAVMKIQFRSLSKHSPLQQGLPVPLGEAIDRLTEIRYLVPYWGARFKIGKLRFFRKARVSKVPVT